MKRYVCDRCNKAYQPKYQYTRYTISERFIKDNGSSCFVYVDICPKCYEKFCRWLNNG